MTANADIPLKTPLSRIDIETGYLDHAAMAQFLRWFQLYERPAGGVDNAVDVLAPDVVLRTSLGDVQGHETYRAAVSALPDWQNTHHVTQAFTAIDAEGRASLTARIRYENIGILPDGQVQESEISYSVNFTREEDLLPKIAAITIIPEAPKAGEVFEDAYPEMRARSLLHYYLAIVEDPSRDAEPAREIFSDSFSLAFPSGDITDFKGFAAWLAGTAEQIKASTHRIENLKMVSTSDIAMTFEFELDWAGFALDDTELVARTKHVWSIENNIADRFAMITSVDVEILEPFRPKEN